MKTTRFKEGAYSGFLILGFVIMVSPTLIALIQTPHTTELELLRNHWETYLLGLLIMFCTINWLGPSKGKP